MSYYPSTSKPVQNSKPTLSEGARQYSPEYIQRFLEDIAFRAGKENNQAFRNHLINTYGTMEEAVYRVELSLGMGKAREEYQHAPAVAVGEKPKPGEQVALTQLARNVSLRAWNTGLEHFGLLCFDFVYTNDTWRYMAKPKDVQIEAIGPGGVSEGPVLSIEKSLDNAFHGAQRRAVDRSRPYDADWESFVIPAGTHIRIWQGNIQYNIDMSSPCAPTYTHLNWS